MIFNTSKVNLSLDPLLRGDDAVVSLQGYKTAKTKLMNHRLDVLDGLRGFAIILVFLNHIDSYFIAEAVPSFLKPIIHFLFTSGNLGVTFFFILSGFLMGYLYANPQPREFIERRYARIFPPFLVMAFCMWIFRLYPATSLLGRIFLILSVAIFVRTVWIYVVERFHKGSLFVTLFLFLQFAIACWYGFVVMRNPPIWFDSLPYLLKEGTIFAANATLTLPLGNYIPLLDGVYWSLAPEMIFYLLYPYLFSGTVQALKKKGNIFIMLFILSLFPFFFGLSLLFKHSQGLSMLFIEYFIYFCGGIVIAHVVKSQEKKKTPLFIQYFITPLLFILLLFLTYYLMGRMFGTTTILFRLFLVIPFGYIVYSLVEHESPLSNLFKRKTFLFLGTISYSMYIAHTALVDGMHLLFKPNNFITNILFLLVTAVVFLLVSTVLHHIIEKPYFQFKPMKKLSNAGFQNRKIAYGLLLMTLLFLFFFTYTSQFNFFSLQKKYANIIPTTIAISDIPTTFSFIAQENNMGVILVHLTNTVGANQARTKVVDQTKQQRFQIRMKEKGSENWHGTQDTSPAAIGNSASYPFGFPLIADSKNKIYIVEMSIKDIDYESTILFNKDEYELTTIHQIPKYALLKNPQKLLTHILNKLQTAFADPEAQLVAACITPFFILLLALI